jgi:hypothetical protein
MHTLAAVPTDRKVTPANACWEHGTTYETPVELMEHLRVVHSGPYAAGVAAQLLSIAEELAAVTMPTGIDPPQLHVVLNVSPLYGEEEDVSDDARTAVVDAVATALLGVRAETRHPVEGVVAAHGRRGQVHVSVYDAGPGAGAAAAEPRRTAGVAVPPR